jgi:hypothetical protein
VIEYQAQVADGVPDVSPLIEPFSDDSKLWLFYLGGQAYNIPAPNPEVCIHRTDRSADCANFAATLTPPSAETATPTPTTEPPTQTPTNTPEEPIEPTETPTPTVEPTEPTEHHSVFLPVLLADSGFAGG